MNDRFRLRAYVKAHEEVEMVEEINYEAWEVDNKPLFIVGGVGRTEEEIVLMQSTGLKDKNGKLIFEGDIIKVNEFGKPVKVEFYGIGFRLIREPNNTIGYERRDYIPEDCEIIGNIYENKELLNE